MNLVTMKQCTVLSPCTTSNDLEWQRIRLQDLGSAQTLGGKTDTPQYLDVPAECHQTTESVTLGDLLG